MARPRSPALILALEMVAAGATAYAAAKATGLCQSTISRSIRPPIKQRCQCCGRVMPKAIKKASGEAGYYQIDAD